MIERNQCKGSGAKTKPTSWVLSGPTLTMLAEGIVFGTSLQRTTDGGDIVSEPDRAARPYITQRKGDVNNSSPYSAQSKQNKYIANTSRQCDRRRSGGALTRLWWAMTGGASTSYTILLPIITRPPILQGEPIIRRGRRGDGEATGTTRVWGGGLLTSSSS